MFSVNRMWVIAGTGLILAVMTGCGRDGGAKEPPPAPVVTEAARSESVQLHAELIGRLNGSANVDVRARVSGFIEAVNFIEGQQVSKGDVLLRIDPRPYEAVLAQAEAEMARAEAMQVKAADDERRQKQLFEKKTVSEQDYRNAVQANLAAQAAVEAARAARLRAELDLEFATVTAPISGVIGRTDFTEGDYLAAGSMGVPVATLSTLDPIDFEFAVSEAAYLAGAQTIGEFLKVPEAERPRDVTLILGDRSEHPEKGWVFAIDRALDKTTGTIAGRARFTNPGGLLRPGQFARARFRTREMTDAVTVSDLALGDMQGKSFVWVVGDDGRVARRMVDVQARLDGRAVLASGLEPGERVVIEGQLSLSEGRKVAEAPAAPDAPPGGASAPTDKEPTAAPDNGTSSPTK